MYEYIVIHEKVMIERIIMLYLSVKEKKYKDSPEERIW